MNSLATDNTIHRDYKFELVNIYDDVCCSAEDIFLQDFPGILKPRRSDFIQVRTNDFIDNGITSIRLQGVDLRNSM